MKTHANNRLPTVWRLLFITAQNERSCHQRQSSWNSFVLNDF